MTKFNPSNALSHDLLALAAQQLQTEKELQVLEARLAENDQEIQELSIQATVREQLLHKVSTELAERNAQLDRLNASLGGRLLRGYGKVKYAYLLPIYRLLHLSTNEERRENHKEQTVSVATEQAESGDESADDDAARSDLKLGIMLAEDDLPSE